MDISIDIVPFPKRLHSMAQLHLTTQRVKFFPSRSRILFQSFNNHFVRGLSKSITTLTLFNFSFIEFVTYSYIGNQRDKIKKSL